MSDDANTLPVQEVAQSSASTSKRPKPPEVLEREPEPPVNGLLDRLIKYIAV
jgi:hypothetical protein